MTPVADPSDRENATGKPRFRLARKLQFLEHILAEWKEYLGEKADSQTLWENFWDDDEIFGGTLPGLEGTVHQHSRTLDRLMLDEYKAWYEEWMYYRKDPRVGHGPGTPYSDLMEDWHFAQYERAEYQQAREKIDKRYGGSSSSKTAVPSDRLSRPGTEGAAATPSKKAVQQPRSSKSLRQRADSDTTITTAMSTGWAAINDNTPASSVADNTSKDRSPAEPSQTSKNAQDVPETISQRQQLARRISEQVAAMAVVDDRGSIGRDERDEQAPWNVADVRTDSERRGDGVAVSAAIHSAPTPKQAKDDTATTTKPASTSPAESLRSTGRSRKRSLPWTTLDEQHPRPLKSRARGTQSGEQISQVQEHQALPQEQNQSLQDGARSDRSRRQDRGMEGGRNPDQAAAHPQQSQHEHSSRHEGGRDSTKAATQAGSLQIAQERQDRDPNTIQPGQDATIIPRPTLPITPTTSDPVLTQDAQLLKQSASPPISDHSLPEHAQHLSALLQNPSATLSAIVAESSSLSQSLRLTNLGPPQPLTSAQTELAEVLPEIVLNAAKAALGDPDPVTQCAQLVRDLGAMYRGWGFR